MNSHPLFHGSIFCKKKNGIRKKALVTRSFSFNLQNLPQTSHSFLQNIRTDNLSPIFTQWNSVGFSANPRLDAEPP
ncbi:hypothetical protein LEP1GSC162_2562 [Leptospira santarosai str. CBC1531]|nr:hypothetical protein LEP1GSC162_2562 [Leptospira santarosai str. CBC1531]